MFSPLLTHRAIAASSRWNLWQRCAPMMPPAPGACTRSAKPTLPTTVAQWSKGQSGARGRSAHFGRGLHCPALTSSYSIEEGVAVIDTGASLLPVPTIRICAPVLEVSEDLPWELDGQALGWLPWDGARRVNCGEGAWKRVSPKHYVSTKLGSKNCFVPLSGTCPPLYSGGKDPYYPQNICTILSLVANKHLASPAFPALEDLVPIPHALPHLPPQLQRNEAHPHHAPCM